MTRWPDDKTEARMRQDISDSEVYYESDMLGRTLGEDAAELIDRIRLLEGFRDKCIAILRELDKSDVATKMVFLKSVIASVISEAEKT